MDLELVKFIDSDLTWNAVKKGHRSMMRRPRRTELSGSEFGFHLGNKMQDPVVFDFEKSGVAILGRHFAEEVLDVPIKKRILLLQSQSVDGDQSPQPHTPSPNHEGPQLPVGSKHASGAMKQAEKEVPDLNDFFGIELLAAAACQSSVYDSSDHVESSAMEEHTTPRVDSYTDSIKEDVYPMGFNDLSVQDNAFPVTKNLCDNGNDGSAKSPVPSKGVRLHWDLNTVMNEWEEPCDILVDPHSERSYLKDVYIDGLQNAKVNLKVYEQGRMLSGKQDDAISVVPLSTPAVSGIQTNHDGGYLGKPYDAESCISKSDVVDSFVNPASCENISTSIASVSLKETTIKVKSDDRHTVSEVVQGGCLSLKGDTDEKVTIEDHFSDCCGSNVSQVKVKSGYDSPVEDGELREPARHQWQKEDSEEMECVDFESDNMYEDNFDTIESVTNEIPLDNTQTVETLDVVSKSEIDQGDKADALHSKTSQSAILEEKDSSSRKFLPERKNVLRIDRSASASFGVSRNAACIHRNRSERDFGQDKFMGRDGPSYQGGQWVDSVSKLSHGYPRVKSVRSGGSGSIDNNQAINYNLRGIHRSFNTRPSPSGRCESYGINRGTRRAPQEEYNNRDSCYSERKVPFLFSNYTRGANLSRPRIRSRTRSRSGSPIAWHFQKKRNVDTKRHSPDHKSDMRPPFRKPSEIQAVLRVSPQCVSRSFYDRKVIDKYRDRGSSPVSTIHGTHKRLDSLGYLGKPKSNDHFSLRYPSNNSNYSSIHDDRYGMVNERRRSRYDDDESFKGYSRNKDNSFRYP